MEKQHRVCFRWFFRLSPNFFFSVVLLYLYYHELIWNHPVIDFFFLDANKPLSYFLKVPQKKYLRRRKISTMFMSTTRMWKRTGATCSRCCDSTLPIRRSTESWVNRGMWDPHDGQTLHKKQKSMLGTSKMPDVVHFASCRPQATVAVLPRSRRRLHIQRRGPFHPVSPLLTKRSFEVVAIFTWQKYIFILKKVSWQTTQASSFLKPVTWN